MVAVCGGGRVATERPADLTRGPTSTPAPHSTPVPTERPIPTASPERTSETFDPIALSGKGSNVVKFVIPEGIPAVGIVAYTGSSNFVVWTVAAEGAWTAATG